jgi:hypothetical protein
VEQTFEFIHEHLNYKLKGILHFAGVLADGTIQNMTAEDFQIPYTKLWGCWNLHRAAAKYPQPDFFIATTSLNDFVGFEQSNYISSNTAVQQLMAYRRKKGLPAVAMGLSPVVGCGMLEENPDAARYLASTGMDFMTVDEVCQALYHIATSPIEQVPPYIMCGKVQSLLDTEFFTGTMFSHLIHPRDKSGGGTEELTPEVLLKNLKKKVAEMFCLAEQDVDSSVPLLDIGLDSLTGIELIVFANTLKMKVSMADIITGASIDMLVAGAQK